MDKIFNFFSKVKSKEEVEKLKKNSIINTQNLQKLTNINHGKVNIENNNNSETNNTINFSLIDIENIDKILSDKNQYNNDIIKIDTNSDFNKVNNIENTGSNKNDKSLPFNSKTINEIIYINELQSEKLKFEKNSLNNPHNQTGDIILVNSLENIKKPIDGYYSKKYSEQLASLKSVNLNFY